MREALKQLESEGLVRHVPDRGTFVSEVTSADIEEIFALREILEIKALQVGLLHISAEEIEKVEEELLALEEGGRDDDFFESDRLLHSLVVRYSGNRRLVGFLNTINAQIERIRRISALRPHRLAKSKQEHLAIIRAIKTRDLRSAERLLREHIHNVKQSSLEVIHVVDTK